MRRKKGQAIFENFLSEVKFKKSIFNVCELFHLGEALSLFMTTSGISGLFTAFWQLFLIQSYQKLKECEACPFSWSYSSQLVLSYFFLTRCRKRSSCVWVQHTRDDLRSSRSVFEYDGDFELNQLMTFVHGHTLPTIVSLLTSSMSAMIMFIIGSAEALPILCVRYFR